MIQEVDLALRSLIEREATDGTEVEVVFDAPTKDWASRRNVPTIDVYLYDIREDLRRRERGLINSYDGDRVTSRHLPPRHFKLSYLVTAWTQRPEDEHRLLSALLSCFLRHDAIPPDLITGPLAELGLPVPVTIALPPPEDRSFADVWSALGGELKPSLDVVISAPADTGQQYEAGPPVVKPGAISFGGLGAWPPVESRQQNDGATRARLATGPGGRSADGVDRTAGDGVGDVHQAGDGDGGTGADSGTGGGGSRGSGRRDEAARTAAVQARIAAGGGIARPARGMSWQELAGGSGGAEPAASDADQQAEAGRSDVARERAPRTEKKSAPTRRRRQGGINQQ